MNTIDLVNAIFDRAEAAMDATIERHNQWCANFLQIVDGLGADTKALTLKALDKGWAPLQIDGDGTVWFYMDKARAKIVAGKWTLVRGK